MFVNNDCWQDRQSMYENANTRLSNLQNEESCHYLRQVS